MDAPKLLLPGFKADDLEKFRRESKVWRQVDIYEEQLKELHEITYPDNSVTLETFSGQKGKGDLAGAWVYYPWSGVLLHCVGPEDLKSLRTNRNQNLINEAEQGRLASSPIGIAGMSVGSGIALACAQSGMADTIKLADFDRLQTTNLNRVRESLASVGSPKVQLAAQRLYELNPFAAVQQFEKITSQNIDAFFDEPKLSVVIDEIDDFKMKVQLRVKAREAKVPLLMFTSLGDNLLVDVERYDREPGLALFNGAVGEAVEAISREKTVSDEAAKQYAVRLVGPQYVPTRAMGSLLEMGKKLVGRPQLYSTVAVGGGLAAYVARCIILDEPLESGRYFVKFSELVGQPAADLADSPERQDILNKLMKR